MKLRRLSNAGVVRAQSRGYFDEHLATFYSVAYGEPHLYNDEYLVYLDAASKTVSLTLFRLDSNTGNDRERSACFEEVTAQLKPERVVVTSPARLPSEIGGFDCVRVYEDKDFQIALKEFDVDLAGGRYKSLRYRVSHAKRCGYKLSQGKLMTPAHINIMAHHLAEDKDYEMWDYQLYLGLSQYVSKFDSPRFLNVFLGDVMVGFDVVDVVGDDVMVVPLGFYMDYPSIADFLIYEEVCQARDLGFRWLDVGWACNVSGLEEFKIKWKAFPRFRVCMQVFSRQSVT